MRGEGSEKVLRGRANYRTREEQILPRDREREQERDKGIPRMARWHRSIETCTLLHSTKVHRAPRVQSSTRT